MRIFFFPNLKSQQTAGLQIISKQNEIADEKLFSDNLFEEIYIFFYFAFAFSSSVFLRLICSRPILHFIVVIIRAVILPPLPRWFASAIGILFTRLGARYSKCSSGQISQNCIINWTSVVRVRMCSYTHLYMRICRVYVCVYVCVYVI